MDKEQVYSARHLREEISRSARSQGRDAVMEWLEISPSYLDQVLNGSRRPSKKIAAKLGYRLVRPAVEPVYIKDNAK